MKHLVFYESEGSCKGNVDCNFLHYPPSLQDIRELEKDISERFCQGKKALVTGWAEILDEDSQIKCNYADCINIKIGKDVISAGTKILLISDNRESEYTAELGLYSYKETSHMGWYLKHTSEEDTDLPITALIESDKLDSYIIK